MPLRLLHTLRQGAKTYRAGLLQAKVYRILKDETAKILKPAKISTLEWALLGALSDYRQGLQLKVLADKLGVEPAFVTVMVQALKKRGLVTRISHEHDKRSKVASLTEAGVVFIQRTEKMLRGDIRPLFTGINARDLLAYLRVLSAIEKNAASKK